MSVLSARPGLLAAVHLPAIIISLAPAATEARTQCWARSGYQASWSQDNRPGLVRARASQARASQVRELDNVDISSPAFTDLRAGSQFEITMCHLSSKGE